jgi:photoactive yellow protein
MNGDELDQLPFGAIVIDRAGIVVKYNAYESQLSGMSRERVIGRHFFREIAPCAAVAAFEGRLHTFVDESAPVSTTFTYVFAFSTGPVDVAITFVRLKRGESVLIAVERIADAAIIPATRL